ncbi:SDR family NAD(P)-dependent oxidoreductase [Tistrella sp. BH-R2-4]|uniref:SDR family NAD(P)-dependent oxidoreductase n=1 Tax=Tistrella arctica TaxID=3133430 RepID=A0ABU9YQP3_9PROT
MTRDPAAQAPQTAREQTASLLDRLSSLTPAQRAALKQRLAGRDGTAGTTGGTAATAVAGGALPMAGRRAPLSPAQSRFRFLMDGGQAGDAYAMAAVLRIDGPLDAERLALAAGDVVAAQASLRTRIIDTPAGPVQEVLPVPAAALERVTLDLPADADDDMIDAALSAAATEARCSPFDAATGPLSRLRLIRCRPGPHRPDLHGLVVVLHHVIADGWSIGLCLAEIQDAYARRGAGLPPAPPPARQAFEEAERLVAARADGAAGAAAHHHRLSYWVEMLAGAPSRLALDGGTTGAEDSADGALPARHIPLDIPPALAAALTGLSRRVPGATLFTGLLAAFQAALARFTGMDDLTVAVAVANRNDPALDRTIGEFADVVVLRAALNDDSPADRLLTAARDAAIDAQAHDGITLAEIMDAIDQAHGADARPAIDAAFSFLNVPVPAAARDGLTFRSLPVAGSRLDFALYLTVYDLPGGGLGGSLSHAPDRVPAALADAIAASIPRIAAALAADGDVMLSALPLAPVPFMADLAQPSSATDAAAVWRDWLARVLPLAAGDRLRIDLAPELAGHAAALAHALAAGAIAEDGSETTGTEAGTATVVIAADAAPVDRRPDGVVRLLGLLLTDDGLPGHAWLLDDQGLRVLDTPARLIPVAGGPDGRLTALPVGAPGQLAVVEAAGRLRPAGSRGRRLACGRIRPLPDMAGRLPRHGLRIGPDDVAAAIRRRPDIADLAVAIRTDRAGQPLMLAWVATTIAAIDPLHVAEDIRAALPAGLRPDLVVPVAAIPRDSTGRPDLRPLHRIALPAAPAIDGEAAVLFVDIPAAGPGRRHLSDLPGHRPMRHADEEASVTDAPADGSDWLVPGNPPPPAFADGGPLVLPEDAPTTLDSALVATAARYPARGILHDDGAGEPQLQRYDALLAAARGRLGALQATGLGAGDRAVLVFADLALHLETLWACILGGIQPVTVAVPQAADDAVLAKLVNTHTHLSTGDRRPAVLTSADVATRLASLTAEAGMAALPLLAIDRLAATGDGRPHVPAPDDVAVIQLSSGSTGTPKCIPITHRGVIAHIWGQVAAFGHQPDDVSMNWLPLDHVVPMLTCHLKDTVLGRLQIQAPTAAVLADPLLWLDLIERHRVTLAWAPNFAFKLVSTEIDRRAGIDRQRDLSSIRWFINAGEQVTAPVVDGFLRALAPHGLRPGAVRNEFGMAELCTVMTGGVDATDPDAVHLVAKSSLSGRLRRADGSGPGATAFVDAGWPIPGVAIRIADADGGTCPEGVIGRFQARGAVTTPGYIDNPAANATAFADAGWFDTGDLGFIARGRLVLTGREKEVIVVRGTNHHAHEIEDIAGTAPGIAATFVAATAVDRPELGTEGVAIFYVPEADADGDADDAPARAAEIRALTTRLARSLGLTPAAVVPLDRAAFPKTTSGKIQRTALRRQLESGAFDARLKRISETLGIARSLPDVMLEPVMVPAAPRAGPSALAVSARPIIEDRLPAGMELAAAIHRRQSVLTGLAAAGADGELVSVTIAGDVTAAAVDTFTAAALAEHQGADGRAWRLRRIGVDPATPEALIRAEIDHGIGDVTITATGDRLMPALRPAPERSTPDLSADGPVLRPGGHYLITGGLGGIGQALARHLIDRGAGALLIVGRRDPADPAVAAACADLGRAGAAIRYAAAELGAPSAMPALTAALHDAEAAAGRPLDGIFHLAGRYREAPAVDETAASVAGLAAVKLAGFQQLHDLLTARRTGTLPDTILIGFSSVVAHLPAASTAAYAAANAGMEALASHLRTANNGHGPRILTIAWSQWDGPGMGQSVTGAAGLARARGLLPVMPEDGMMALEVAIAAGLTRAVIGVDRSHPFIRPRVIDPAAGHARTEAVLLVADDAIAPAPLVQATDRFGTRLRPRVVRVARLPRGADGRIDPAAAADLARNRQIAAAVAPRTATEHLLARIWSALLPAPVTSIDADFFAQGGHSLLAARIVARITEAMADQPGADGQRAPLTLAPAVIFDAPTIRALAARIDALRAAHDLTDIDARNDADADDDFEEGAL